MLILIVLLPLIGFLSGSLFGRYLGKMVCVTTTASVVSSLLLSFYLFYDDDFQLNFSMQTLLA